MTQTRIGAGIMPDASLRSSSEQRDNRDAVALSPLRGTFALASTHMSTVEHTTPSATPAAADTDAPLVSVVIPCLNEEENIEQCVQAALGAMERAGIPGEVVVADNDSEDRSAELASAAGARVVHEPRRGYGSAYLAGFAAARGRYIVMGDADLTYDFEEIPKFVEELDKGA